MKHKRLCKTTKTTGLAKRLAKKRVVKSKPSKPRINKPGKSKRHVKPSPANRKLGSKHRHAGQTYIVKKGFRANKPVKYWSKVVLRGGSPDLIQRGVAGQTVVYFDDNQWYVDYNTKLEPTMATLGVIENVVGELPPGTGKIAFLSGTNGTRWWGFFDTKYNPNNAPGVHTWKSLSGLPSYGDFAWYISEMYDAQPK